MTSRKTRKGAADKPLVHSTATQGAKNHSRQMALVSLRQRAKQSILTNVDELLNPFFWVEIFVEFVVCTCVLMLVTCALVTLKEHAYKPSTTHFGLFAAFCNVGLITAYVPLCGAPMNPAGAWGFFVAGRITLVRALLFSVAEISGGAAGGMIAISLTPAPQAQALMPILPGPGMTAGMGMAVEGILTFNLLVIGLSCTDPEIQTCVMPSLPIATWIGTAVFAAGTYTGGLQNPIIPFGPAVASRNFTMHFPVYWAGPYIGATVGAVFYKLVVLAKKRLNRHRVPDQPEVEDDTSEKNYKSETHYPDNGQLATRL